MSECRVCGYGAGPDGICGSCVDADKAAQWDAAQPMIEAMTAVVEAAGLEHWPTDCPYIGCRVCKALHALDQLLPQDHPESED